MSGGTAKRRWVRWLMPALTLVLLGLFARRVDWSRAWAAISHADPALLAVAMAANLASLVVKGIRWWLFLDAVGLPGVAQSIRATFVGAALNNVLVANGGDAARVGLVARRGNVSTAPVVATLALDRFGDLTSYSVLFVGAAFALPLSPELAPWRNVVLATLMAFAVVGAALVVRRRPATSEAGDEASDATRSKPRRYWRKLVAAAASISSGRRLAAALGLSLVAWAGQWATFHCAARATGFPISPAGSLLALLTVNAGFLVRLTPGNIGVVQLLYALSAASSGLDKDRAVAVAFLIQMIQYIPVTFVGLLLAPSLARRSTRAEVAPATASHVGRPEQP